MNFFYRCLLLNLFLLFWLKIASISSCLKSGKSKANIKLSLFILIISFLSLIGMFLAFSPTNLIHGFETNRSIRLVKGEDGSDKMCLN